MPSVFVQNVQHDAKSFKKGCKQFFTTGKVRDGIKIFLTPEELAQKRADNQYVKDSIEAHRTLPSVPTNSLDCTYGPPVPQTPLDPVAFAKGEAVRKQMDALPRAPTHEIVIPLPVDARIAELTRRVALLPFPNVPTTPLV